MTTTETHRPDSTAEREDEAIGNEYGGPRVVVSERHHLEPGETERWTDAERLWWSLGPFAGEIPGLVRRVRRILDVSQRGLAKLLGVSQSVVARWETGRTSPRAIVLHRLLDMANVKIGLTDKDSGEVVEPMRDDGARNRAGSRFPAHADLKAKGWWIPRHLRTWTTNDAYRWHKRSRLAEQPSIGYRASRHWKRLEREVWGTPIDHPAHHQVVAELHARDEQRMERRRQAA
ncbi:HTH-type transcriptional regulator/antitoxin HipB [Nocardioides sp. BE266]|uniref:helix-turn-helix domain-containing protein n=1 Tax=Nocardioides sp. BE266 TaxID=2817725 RepID=UPI0028585E6B|nr:helix-turn-helix transcriptional regulator [Nocardioides sp. BE266]MDR7253451.1 HTH-type transcriptional regulator/antitoxin HipB [Nocardioides sp. BE266]